MNFLNVAFLAGSVLVAVPIVLHLIMRRQPRRLEFPALRLVRKRENANRRRLRLRHLLLLAARCAAIVLLAAALARPSIVGSGMLDDEQAPVAAALVLDTAPRMDYRHANQTRLDAAKETARWLLAQLPAESDVTIVDAQTAAPVFSVDPGAARQRLARLDTSALVRPLPEVAEDSLRLLSTSAKQRKELYVFTDLSKAAWPESSVASLRRQLAASAGVGLYVIDVGVEQPRNFALGELRLSGQVLSRNSRLSVQTEAAVTGAGEQRAIELSLVQRGGPAIERRQTVKLASGAAQKIEFGVGGLVPGVHQGVVRIAGGDALPADDVRYFTVEIKPAWRVLLAAPPKADDYALFLREAISPHSLRVQGTAAFECDVAEIGGLSKRDLGRYAAVCLLDPGPLPVETWQKLSGYAAQGGAVGIFLGHNARLDEFNQPAPQELLPGKLVRLWRAPEGGLHLAPDNLQHPLLARFRSVETSIPWDSLPVFCHWALGAPAKGVAVIVNYSNDLPAIVEKPLGKGRVLTMTTPVSDPASRRDTWNLLPTGDEPWPFVMLANEMMYYLVGHGETQLNYRAGDQAVLRLGPGQSRPIFLLSTPRGDQLRQPADERQQSVSVTSTDTPGNYRLTAGGSQGAVDLGFSVNLAPAATKLERLSTDQLKAALGDTPFRLARTRDQIDRSQSVGRAGRELYPYLMLLLVLVLGIEGYMSNRFYRRQFSEQSERGAVQQARDQIERTRHSELPAPVGAA